MKHIIAPAVITVAVAAAAMAVVWGFIVPYGYPWLSLASALVACGAGIWLVKRSAGSTRSMGDIIGDVEGEPVRVAVPKPGGAKQGVVSR
jgi:hypothetical protein